MGLVVRGHGRALGFMARCQILVGGNPALLTTAQFRVVEQSTDKSEHGILVKVSSSRVSAVSPKVLRHVLVDEPEFTVL